MASTYEHLMTVVGEEAVEVAKCISKIIRFGPEAIGPEYNQMNVERLEDEIHDFIAAVCEVVERGYIYPPTNETKVLAKRLKILQMLEHARNVGTVHD